MIENWKDAVGFEGYYEISDLGNARRKGKIKNLTKVHDNDGYIVFCFCINTVRTNVTAHQLVAAAFIGPCPPNHVVRHNDGLPYNNVPSNLLHGTNKQNSEDMVRHGTQAKGENCHLSTLTEQAVLSIRRSTKSQKELAQLYGVSAGNISQIISRRTWKHI